MVTYDDITQAYEAFKSSLWETYLKNIRIQVWDVSERASYLQSEGQEWRTNINMPIQQEMLDAMYAHIIDSIGTFEVEKASMKAWTSAEPEVIKQTLNYVYKETNAWKRALLPAVKDSVAHGNGYIKTIWDTQEESVEYVDNGVKKTAKLEELSLPSIEYVNIFSVVLDPAASSVQTARWVAERKFLTWGWIFEKYSSYLWAQDEEDTKKKVEARKKESGDWGAGTSEDYTLKKQEILLSISTDREQVDSKFTPTDGSMEVYEVLDRKGQAYLFVGGVKIYEWPSQYPFKGYPLHSIAYDKMTSSFLGQGIQDKTKWYQDLVNIYINTHADNVKLAWTPAFQHIVGTGQSLFESTERIDIKPMQVFNVEQKDWLSPLNLQIQDRMLEEIWFLRQSAQTAAGINEMAMGAQWKVERSASAVNNLMQSFKARMRPLFNSIADVMSTVWKQWLYMLIAYTDAKAELEIKIDSVDWSYTLKEMKAEDLHWKWNVAFSIAWLNTSTKDIEKKSFQDVLPILWGIQWDDGKPIMNPRVAMEKVIKLWDLPPEFIKVAEAAETSRAELPPEQQGVGAEWMAAMMGWANPWWQAQLGTPNAVDESTAAINSILGWTDGGVTSSSPQTEVLKQAAQI